MTRLEILKSFEVYPNSVVIRTPGKFEGEPIYAPYFWDLSLEGMADSYSDDGEVITFQVTDDDRAEFPELTDVKYVRLHESDNGFVFCHCE